MPWLMKAEPDSRVVKGKDVKFSVDDFEEIGISPWDGVRNHEAKKIMKEKMKLGDKVLFYHSNCKTPGVFALAVIAKEGYPDYTAWDESHPYYDPKTDKDHPTWYMVSVEFKKRLEYPPTLQLIKHLVSLPSLPDSISYIGKGGLAALKGMALVNRGRLSVQPVTEEAYEAIVQLGTQGGWDDLLPQGGLKKVKSEEKAVVNGEEAKPAAPSRKKRTSRTAKEESPELSDASPQVKEEVGVSSGSRRSKRSRK